MQKILDALTVQYTLPSGEVVTTSNPPQFDAGCAISILIEHNAPPLRKAQDTASISWDSAWLRPFTSGGQP